MRGILLFLSVSLLFGSIGVKGQSLFGEQQVISTEVDGVNSIDAVDLDGDGHIDVLSTSINDNKIAWYKNNGNGSFGEQNIIENLGEARFVHASDIDNDGDMDILFAALSEDIIGWYENDGKGNFSGKNIISTNAKTPQAVYAVDLDNDGNADVITTSWEFNEVAWYKNDGGGNFGLKNSITTEAQGAKSVYAADLDNDGDMDVLSASYTDNKIAWYENDGNGSFSEPNIITTVYGASSVYASDLDRDGDIDVLSASREDNKIAWYENYGNGLFGQQNIITANAQLANSVYASDLDKDGDMDVLSASWYDKKIAWYENYGNGLFGQQNIITTNEEGANSVYAIDLDNDGSTDVLYASFITNKVAWHKNILNFNKINSFSFHDLNKNGIHEEDEKPFSNQHLFLQPSAATQFTNIEGNASFYVENGEYQLSAEPNTLWELTTPETYHITVTDNSELPTYYFGFKPTRIFPRVKPHLNSSPTRCSQEATYWLHYSNTGTTVANGTVTLEVDELMGFISSNPEPDNIEGNTLTWHFSEIYPSYENKIHLQFQMPDFNSMGEILESQATVQIFNDNQEIVYSKTTEYDSEVLCSYDPNDKLARSNLLGQSEFAYLGDTILYTVRFQNTGNDTAFNIRIEDVLDKKLDWTTFHPITASHDYRTELNRETGLVTFHFNDILLPDSTTNEPESHGFVLFGIASKSELEDKTKVDNTASIFFDFNPPIITNTAVVTLIEGVETNIEDSLLDNGYSILVRPNPFSDYTTIEVNGLSAKGNYRLEVMDILGRKVGELKLDEGRAVLQRGDLESGLYLVRVVEEDSNEILESGKVLVE